jgi:uncharacterized integral membrane protein (TIGR00698 family)
MYFYYEIQWLMLFSLYTYIESAMVSVPHPRLPQGSHAAASRVSGAVRARIPGLLLTIAVSIGAFGLQFIEARVFGHVWLEALVLAILLGTAVRSLWTPGDRWHAGIGFSAKILLEIAVVLLGASLSVAALKASGGGLILGIMAVVVIAIVLSYVIGRALGLHRRLALLIACGNSICGNSAIAAVAPVIGAHGDDVAASIAFTAVLGVVVVLGLPLLMPVLHLSEIQYGTLAGLTVYAVPQVLAATAPVSALSAHIGTLVKLVRVLMLGPVILGLSIVMRSKAKASAVAGANQERHPALAWHKIVPWFIIGFLALAAARSVGAIPEHWLEPINGVANVLTIFSMAALGLGVDVRTVAKAGPRVTTAVVVSIIALGAISVGLIHLLQLG